MAIAALLISIGAVIASVVGLLIARRAARAAELSAEEARRARLDSQGPTIAVVGQFEDRTRWVLNPIYGHINYVARAYLNPIPEYVLPRDAKAMIAIGATLILRMRDLLRRSYGLRARQG